MAGGSKEVKAKAPALLSNSGSSCVLHSYALGAMEAWRLILLPLFDDAASDEESFIK